MKDIARRKAWTKAYNATPEVKAKIAAYNATPERRARQRISQNGRKAKIAAYNARPEIKAKNKAYNATPARRAKHPAVQKASDLKRRLRDPALALFKAVKYRAGRKGRVFTLTAPLAIPADCECCEEPIVSGIGTGKGGNPDSPSYDCLIPSLDYIDGNVRLICNRCNMVKGDGSISEHTVSADGIDDFYANPPPRDEGPPTREEWRHFKAKARRAKQDGDAFTLSGPLWHPPFCYCGRALFKGEGRPIDNSPSHDCVDPELEYVDGNVRIICNRCNTVKKHGDARRHRQVIAYMIRHA